jgi:hypothetical protein
MLARTAPAIAALSAALLLSACTDADPGASSTPVPSTEQVPSSTAAASTAPAVEAESEAPAPVATKRLDSIAVLGHSGATGTVSDPDDPGRDATENSWATGDNPTVNSVYRRLLETHPALEGHNYNAAMNGSGVDDLAFQIESLTQDAAVVPDLVMIQTIDNDIRCDGTDVENLRPFGRTLDQALTQVESDLPGARVFLVSPWATVEAWTEWAQQVPAQVSANSGTGPCDVFDQKGRPRPAGIASMQAIVDGYLKTLDRVCGRHPGCATDGRALEREFVPVDADLSLDHNHLSIAGHTKYAEIAWTALPQAIKDAR